MPGRSEKAGSGGGGVAPKAQQDHYRVHASFVFRDLTICAFFVVESCGLSWRSAGKK